MGRCGRISCSFPAAIKLPVKVSDPMITSSADFGHAEARDVGHADVIFGDADHRGGKRAERVAQRGSLRHGGHLHHAEGNADGGADDQRNDDPLVLRQLGIEERGDDREGRGNFADQHAAAGRGRAS